MFGPGLSTERIKLFGLRKAGDSSADASSVSPLLELTKGYRSKRHHSDLFTLAKLPYPLC